MVCFHIHFYVHCLCLYANEDKMANGVFQLYFIEVAYPFYRSDSHQIIDLGSLDHKGHTKENSTMTPCFSLERR